MVYGTEIPHYDFSYSLKDADGGKTVARMTLTQSGVSDAFLMKVPLYAWIQGTPRPFALVSIKGSNTATGDVTLSGRPEKITLDEFHTILAEEKQ
jgi:hypothetical protein